MGNTSDDSRLRKFMIDIAAITGEVFRCMDPFTPLHQEFGDNPDFSDDEFVDYFQERLRELSAQLLQNVGLYTQQ
ncbi:unnamed protein product [Rotaria sordida]|nr:unnamed protein product [Rotaria sordida]